jgi:hypothetical protein
MPLKEEYARGHVIKMSLEITILSTVDARCLPSQDWKPISRCIQDDHWPWADVGL